MQEQCIYRIEIQGPLEAKNFNLMSPYRINEVQVEPAVTFFTVYADQSGLVGLIRHLHQQGFVLLSIRRQEGGTLSGGKNEF